MIRKVHTYIPQSSVIGRLLNHQETYTVVQSIANGIMQHDLYSWQVMGSKFISLEEVTSGSLLVDKTIKDWVKEVSPKQRAQFVEVLFEILNITESTTLEDLSNKKIATTRLLVKRYQSIEDDNKELISKTIHALLGIIKNNVMGNISQKSNNKTRGLKENRTPKGDIILRKS